MAQLNTKRTSTSRAVWYAVAAGRLLLGWILLWAFIDKLFGFEHATTKAHAWVHGGSPTSGFLHAANGPFASFFHSLAGHTWVDWLFMIGLAGIGSALVLGICVRLAAITGTLLFAMMWAASLPIKTNPFVDEHWIYITLLWVIALGYSEQVVSLGTWWRGTRLGRSGWLW